MTFNSNPFEQAKSAVTDKSTMTKIGHSGPLHSLRSAFSSSGSAYSLGYTVAGKAVKAALGAIPLPGAGALAGLVVDWMSSNIKDIHYQQEVDKAKHAGDLEKQVKFAIKTLTLEHLDAFRMKVTEAIKELNAGLDAFYASGQTCDDVYRFALLSEQVKRRRQKLKAEIGKFQAAIDLYRKWDVELDSAMGKIDKYGQWMLLDIVKDVDAILALNRPDPRNVQAMQQRFARHLVCREWCYCKADQSNWPFDQAKLVKHVTKVRQVVEPLAKSGLPAGVRG